MYLIDTNIWLERLLDQEKTDIVGKFLNIVPSDQLYITDFSLHSIGVILHRLNNGRAYVQFIEDIFANGDVSLISLTPSDMAEVLKITEAHNLDFDDGYQYLAAEKYHLEIVSFDRDFENTPRGRTSPEELVHHLKEHSNL